MNPITILTAYKRAVTHEHTWEQIYLDPRRQPAHDEMIERYWKKARRQRANIEMGLFARFHNAQARLTAADALIAAIIELRNGEPISLTPEQLRLWRAYAEMKEK